jgi:predicted porin
MTSAFATSAFAQNSVTLYGVIDEGIDFTNNVGGSHVYELTSGYAQGSRWGLKGSEDLGGGLKTIFQIESGFNVNTGKLAQGGLGFGRQAYVGLESEQYGTVTFGRQYDSVVDYLAQTTANGTGAAICYPIRSTTTTRITPSVSTTRSSMRVRISPASSSAVRIASATAPASPTTGS